jgi:hypothetical protein
VAFDRNTEAGAPTEKDRVLLTLEKQRWGTTYKVKVKAKV